MAVNVVRVTTGAVPAGASHLLVLADGFTAGAQMNSFISDVTNLNSAMKAISYWSIGTKLFLWRAETPVASTDPEIRFYGGCNKPNPIPRTRFGSYYQQEFGVCRYLIGSTGALGTTLLQIKTDHAALPPFSRALVLVNCQQYGGSGVGNFAWASRTSGASVNIAMHEIGHLYGLHDEYESKCGTADSTWGGGSYSDKNISTSKTSPPWKQIGVSLKYFGKANCSTCANLDDGTAATTTRGAFEGANFRHCNFKRPALRCRMRDVTDELCDYCKSVVSSA